MTQCLINTGYLFFRNPPLSQISAFSLGQKGCAYYEKGAYYEWVQYLKRGKPYFRYPAEIMIFWLKF